MAFHCLKSRAVATDWAREEKISPDVCQDKLTIRIFEHDESNSIAREKEGSHEHR